MECAWRVPWQIIAVKAAGAVLCAVLAVAVNASGAAYLAVLEFVGGFQADAGIAGKTWLSPVAIGAILACQSMRATDEELAACLDLVAPAVTLASERAAERHDLPGKRIVLGAAYERALASAEPWAAPPAARAEDVAVIIYTSGTTGLPKGACISHRAEIVRSMATRADLGIGGDDAFVAWSPLHHMGALDNSVSTLVSGGKVVVVDGFRPDELADIVATEPVELFNRVIVARKAPGAAS